MFYYFGLDFNVVFFGISRQTVSLISYGFLGFTAWLVYVKNSVAAMFNVLAISRPCGNIRCFDQNYQPCMITLQVLVLIIKYLVAVP